MADLRDIDLTETLDLTDAYFNLLVITWHFRTLLLNWLDNQIYFYLVLSWKNWRYKICFSGWEWLVCVFTRPLFSNVRTFLSYFLSPGCRRRWSPLPRVLGERTSSRRGRLWCPSHGPNRPSRPQCRAPTSTASRALPVRNTVLL